ncbi:MAG: chalcone isomerase family protein [Candidatus Omnitrophica bacterium]|nr:chalcone isomerase family protein [Candidatus Omnitrophota bacterium]
MNKFRKNIIFFMSVLFLLITAVSVKAGRQSLITNGFSKENMVLLGTAPKRFLTFRVVTVDLYIADGYKSEDVLVDVPKRIEVNYHVHISKKELDQATINGIKRNYSREQLAELIPQINQINSYYPDVKSGDQIAVTYVPELGSQVQLNGKVKGIIPGSDFAKAFFSIWVGENPVDKQAKLKLLGHKNSRKSKSEL